MKIIYGYTCIYIISDCVGVCVYVIDQIVICQWHVESFMQGHVRLVLYSRRGQGDSICFDHWEFSGHMSECV